MGERRAYVIIPTQVLRESWDDSTLADVVRLQAWLTDRWARDKLTSKQAGEAFLDAQAMMAVTKTTNVTRARGRLLALRDRTGGVTLSVEVASQGRFKGVIVKWPKFPKEQKMLDRDPPNPGTDLGLSDSASCDLRPDTGEEEEPPPDRGGRSAGARKAAQTRIENGNPNPLDLYATRFRAVVDGVTPTFTSKQSQSILGIARKLGAEAYAAVLDVWFSRDTRATQRWHPGKFTASWQDCHVQAQLDVQEAQRSKERANAPPPDRSDPEYQRRLAMLTGNSK